MDGRQYNDENAMEKEDLDNNLVIFSLNEKVGTLSKALKIFETYNVKILHIESRFCKRETTHEFLLKCESSPSNFKNAVNELQEATSYFQITSKSYEINKDAVPWFPTKIKDLDRFNEHIFAFDPVVEPDYPALTDPVYQERRKYITNIAYKYKHGKEIPKIDYTEEELETWGKIFRNVTKLHKTNACAEYNKVFPLLVENCGYREDNIPQLQTVSDFLKDCTGFQLRPVAGLLSSRDFLACLAFRVLPCTQYIRHRSKPFYTPEPDICHELLGHVPLFCDPKFAQFSHEIGLASIGAPDVYIEKLSTCYWFTAEFGLCRQNGELKAYGAGLLSGFEELQYCLTNTSELRDFEPEKTCLQEYPLNGYQPIYYVADSFEDAKRKMTQFAATIPRPFAVRFIPYTQSIEILDSKPQIISLINDIRSEIQVLENALKEVL